MESKQLLTWRQEKLKPATMLCLLTIFSKYLFPRSPSLFPSQEEKKESAAFLYAGMEAGWLRPVVGSQYPLDKAAQAHHDIIESPGAAGKIVLTM